MSGRFVPGRLGTRHMVEERDLRALRTPDVLALPVGS
jgi:hypothetical protein